MINSNPLVSVVVITYNSEKYIIDTLNSIVSQSYDNIELIISDDFSLDSTLLKCNQWLENEHHRLTSSKLISAKKNTGIPGNCNRGWKAAGGSWIKFIAGDDILLPNCIADFINYNHLNPEAGVLYSKAEMIDKDGNSLENQDAFYKTDLQGWRDYFFSLSAIKQLKHFSREPVFLVTPSLMVKRNILENINGFDEDLRIFEDIPFAIRCLKDGNKLFSLPSKTVAYRIHDQAVSRSNDKEKELRNLKELGFIFDVYRKPNLSFFSILDFACRYEAWFHFTYALKFRLKGARFFVKLNIYRYYRRIIAARIERKQNY